MPEGVQYQVPGTPGTGTNVNRNEGSTVTTVHNRSGFSSKQRIVQVCEKCTTPFVCVCCLCLSPCTAS